MELKQDRKYTTTRLSSIESQPKKVVAVVVVAIVVVVVVVVVFVVINRDHSSIM